MAGSSNALLPIFKTIHMQNRGPSLKGKPEQQAIMITSTIAKNDRTLAEIKTGQIITGNKQVDLVRPNILGGHKQGDF